MDALWMLSIEFLVIPETVIFRTALNGSLWIKACNSFFLHVENHATNVCFLRKLWVSEKIRSKFVKPWEIKKLTVRPREKQWNRLTNDETVRVERSIVEAFKFKLSLIFPALTVFSFTIVLLPKIGSYHLLKL